MKKLKRKIISLTIAALAFFGAGVFGLKSSATANAAGEVDYSVGITMTEGAAICLSEEFQGIRWETTVKKHETFAKGNEAQFGVIVAPTKALTRDLTHSTNEVRVLDLAFKPGEIVADTANARYYSVVSYKDLSNKLGAAYALDLTARAYVKVDGTYYYANISECDTSRSARSIAIYAELSGQLDEFRASEDANERAKADLAVAYYRAGDASKGQYVPEVSESGLNAGVVDLSSSSKSVKIDDFVVGDTIDGVYVGATSVPFTYEWNALTLTDVGTAPAGEHYATVFTVDGEIYTQPLIFATKILTKADDLAMFRAKGVHSSSTTPNTISRNGDVCYDGYYVLGNNIDASSYVHGSKNYDGSFNTANWNTYDNYVGKAVGLTGTFNGMGYSIDGMTQGSVREGLFGIVNGGTVKNLAITNLKAGNTGDMHALAEYLIGATIENVYIQTNAYNKDDATNNPGFRVQKSAPLAYAAYNNTKIKNVVIDFQLTKDSNQSSAGKTSAGAALTISDATTSYTYENVYCVTPNKVRGAITNPTESKKDQAFPLGLSHTTYVAASGETPATEGYFVWGANSEAKAFDGYVMTKAEGAYLYEKLADMYAAQKDNDAYKALADTGLWSVAEDGTLTWLERAALNPVNPEDEEESPFPNTPVDPEDDLKILLIGNSHSEDTLWGVPQVANAQGVTNYTFGLAIRGGTTMESIVSLSESPSFQYFVSKPNADGTANEAYTKKNAQTLAYALTDQEWDYIFIQLGPWEPVVAGVYADARETIVDFVHKKCPTARIGYSVSWLSPYEYAEGLSADYKKIYNASVELAGGKEDAYYRYEALLNNVKTSLYKEDGVTPNGPHSMVLTVGTPIYYFTEVLRRPVTHLYGDNSKVHLREDYIGRVLAAYSFYTQFMYNIGAITECTVNMDTYNVIDDGVVVGTFDLTQQNNAPKSNIIEAINDMLEDPWTVPGEAPEEPEPETPGAPETPVDPEPETPVDPKDDLKILLVGNSHSRDTFRGIPQVAIAQGVTNYTFAFAKQSGTKMPDQVNNLSESVTDWEYFCSTPSDNGAYGTNIKNQKLNDILAYQEWDYVFIQLGPWDPIIEGIYETERNTVVSHIQTKCPNARIGYSVSWLSPYQKDAKVEASADSLAMYNASVELAGGETTAYARYKALLNNVKTTLYNNDGTPKGPHSMVITVGTPVYYFTEVLKTGLTKVYNDPVHLRMDHIGGILASYSFYMQFMYNIGAITECKVEMNTYSTDTSGGTFDLTQSNNQPKKDIEDAINFMLKYPWTLPGDETVESLEPAEGSLAASYKKILIIGNSHSQDVFLPLPEIFAAEGYNGYTIGTLMLEGASAKDHVAKWGTAAYGFKISTNNSMYANQGKVSLQAALQAKEWDLVFMQNGPTDLAESNNSVDSGNRTTVEGYIKDHCANSNVKIAYHLSWFGPYGDDPDEIQNSVVPEKGYGDVAMTASDYANYDSTSWKIDYRNPKTQHNKYCDLITNNILNNNSNYVGAISTSAAVFYANQVLNRKAGTVADWKARNVNVLYRDELHMSDNGRVLVAYAFFSQFMGVELTEIKLNKLSAAARRQDESADLAITDDWKSHILQSANWAKNNTWTHLS